MAEITVRESYSSGAVIVIWRSRQLGLEQSCAISHETVARATHTATDHNPDRIVMEAAQATVGRLLEGLENSGLLPAEAQDVMSRHAPRMVSEFVRQVSSIGRQQNRIRGRSADLVILDDVYGEDQQATMMTATQALEIERMWVQEQSLFRRLRGNSYRSRVDAESKSVELLRRFLTPEQRESLQQHGKFDVTGSNGRQYRLTDRASNNILDVAAHREYCALPEGQLPIGDQLLAQKLILETDAEKLLNVAIANMLIRSRFDESYFDRPLHYPQFRRFEAALPESGPGVGLNRDGVNDVATVRPVPPS